MAQTAFSLRPPLEQEPLFVQSKELIERVIYL